MKFQKTDGGNDPLAMLSKASEVLDKIPGLGMAKRVHHAAGLMSQLIADSAVMLFMLLFIDAIHIILISGGKTHSTIISDLLGIEWRF